MRINSIGLTVGDGLGCVQMLVGDGAVYLQGSYAEIRAWADSVKAKADHCEARDQKAPEDFQEAPIVPTSSTVEVPF